MTDSGFRDWMPDTEYRKVPALGSTDLARLLDCPATYAYFRDNPSPSTDATTLGSAVHSLLLDTPEEFARKWHVTPAGFSRAASKKFAADCEALAAAEAAGARQLKADDHDQARRIVDAIMGCADAAAIIGKAEARERSAFAVRNGVPVKARFDIDAVTALAIIADLKVVAEPNPRAFARNGLARERAIQAAHYRAVYALAGGDALPDFAWIVAPSEPPYTGRVWVGIPDDDLLRRGDAAALSALRLYAECEAAGVWNGYDTGEIRTLSAPSWWAQEEEPRE